MIKSIKRKAMKDTIARMEEFICGSTLAKIDKEEYKVFSYGTVIGIFSLAEGDYGDLIYFDNTWYSKTTAVVQDCIRQVVAEK